MFYKEKKDKCNYWKREKKKIVAIYRISTEKQ